MFYVKQMLSVHGSAYVAHIFCIMQTCASIFMMDYFCGGGYKRAAFIIWMQTDMIESIDIYKIQWNLA